MIGILKHIWEFLTKWFRSGPDYRADFESLDDRKDKFIDRLAGRVSAVEERLTQCEEDRTQLHMRCNTLETESGMLQDKLRHCEEKHSSVENDLAQLKAAFNTHRESH